MITWVKTEYSAYYDEGVVELTAEQKEDKTNYYKSTHDFVYNGINVSVIKAFMSAKKSLQIKML